MSNVLKRGRLQSFWLLFNAFSSQKRRIDAQSNTFSSEYCETACGNSHVRDFTNLFLTVCRYRSAPISPWSCVTWRVCLYLYRSVSPSAPLQLIWWSWSGGDYQGLGECASATSSVIGFKHEGKGTWGAPRGDGEWPSRTGTKKKQQQNLWREFQCG